jgi:hypothetical protein
MVANSVSKRSRSEAVEPYGNPNGLIFVNPSLSLLKHYGWLASKLRSGNGPSRVCATRLHNECGRSKGEFEPRPAGNWNCSCEQ